MLLVIIFGILKIVSSKKLWWEYTTQAVITNHSSYSIPQRSPFSIDDRRIYVSDYHGFTYGINRQTGKRDWIFSSYNYSPYPVAITSDGWAFISDFDGRVYALDKNTGRERWRFSIPDLIQPDTPVYVTDEHVLFGGRDGILYALDKYSGRLMWQFKVGTPDIHTIKVNTSIIHFGMMAVDGGRVYINSPYQTAFVLNEKNGNILQQISHKFYTQEAPIMTDQFVIIKDGSQQNLTFDRKNGDFISFSPPDEIISNPYSARLANQYIVVGKNNIIFSLSLDKKTSQWQSVTPGDVRSIQATSNNIFISSEQKNRVFLTVLSSKTGETLYEISDIDMDASTLSIANSVLYFLSRTQNTFYALPIPEHKSSKLAQIVDGCCLALSQLTLPDMQLFQQKPKTPQYSLLDHIINTIHYGMNDKIQTTISKQPETTPNTYQLELHHNDQWYTNPWSDVTVTATFTHLSGKQIQVRGFYYDHNTWLVRFLPPQSGPWKWKVVLSNGIRNLKTKGTLNEDSSSDIRGFITINPAYSNSLMYHDGYPFVGVGLQDTMIDHNFDGNPINQWNDIDKQQRASNDFAYVSLDDFFKTYAADNKGFNLYRLGFDNISFRLWKTISPGDNRYGINEGIWADQVVRTLKTHKFRIMMTIFGFEPPYPKGNDATQYQAIDRYLDYVVGRFGPYIDIWELMNEATAKTDWINHTASYIRSIDPYKHPITTSWERPELASIDTDSTHWYDDNPLNMTDIATAYVTQKNKKWNKPVIISEVGNSNKISHQNSALRLRIKLWVSYFEQATLIFWNQIYMFDTDPYRSNLLLGREELQYVKYFRTFTDIGLKQLTPFTLPTQGNEVRTYWLHNDAYILGYFYHYEHQQSQTISSFDLNLTSTSSIMWYDPKKGTTLLTQELPKGPHHIVSPPFTEDVAIKITTKIN